MIEKRELSIDEIKSKILQVAKEMGVSVKDIILFGSRARGNFSQDSDYDFLIITEKTFSIKEKMEISRRINRVSAKFLILSDIIINSEEE
jgi:predicted nucleotidyltransferase